MNEALEPKKDETPVVPAAGDEVEDTAGGDEKPTTGAEETPVADGKKPDEKPAVGTEETPVADAKKPDEKPAVGADGKPAAEKPATPAKAADHLNDPIDPRWKEATRERFQALTTMVRERDAEIAQGRELFTAIESTGMSPEELGTILSYSRLVHSDNIDDRRTAFKFLQGELRGLALQLGETTAGVDIVDEHPDLKEQLEAGQITEAVAREVALSRERAKVETANATRQRETAAEADAARTQAVADMDELGATLADLDPQYEAKAKLLIPKLQPVLSKMHPTQWVAHFRKEYRTFKLPAATVAPANADPAAPTKGQPLRPNKQPSGQGAQQPTSALEAMNAALDGIG